MALHVMNGHNVPMRLGGGSVHERCNGWIGGVCVCACVCMCAVRAVFHAVCEERRVCNTCIHIQRVRSNAADGIAIIFIVELKKQSLFNYTMQ